MIRRCYRGGGPRSTAPAARWTQDGNGHRKGASASARGCVRPPDVIWVARHSAVLFPEKGATFRVMAVTAAVSEIGGACKPNFSPAGRRIRWRFGVTCAVLSAAGMAAVLAVKAPWSARAILFIPIALSAFGFLQVRRNTCVSRAREGTFERDDLSKTPAAVQDAAASRKVARGITRDAVLIGLVGAAAAVATTFLR
jgi:hypothetical protein